VRADVTEPAGLAAAIASAEAARGPLAILINNAGGAESAPFARADRSLWDRMLALNLTAVYEAIHLVLPGMVARGWGRVVTVASTAGLVGYPYVAAYVAAKHGAVGLTRALAREVARSGVTVNAVCPGYTETDLLSASIARIVERTGRTAEQARAALTASNPQGRLVRPEEVAATVVFLCGAGAAAITGQALVVAGGELT
jgi:NAD(P)-dependent dehydrogenase (short-subunit alcohol dehydrogenase family)